jgi:hypothetical protein
VTDANYFAKKPQRRKEKQTPTSGLKTLAFAFFTVKNRGDLMSRTSFLDEAFGRACLLYGETIFGPLSSKLHYGKSIVQGLFLS